MPGFEIFADEERREVLDVLETGVLFRYGFDHVRNGHWKARTFESEFVQRLNVRYCHLCSSGTAALSIALAACGIGAGDEVIVPPFTFIATIEAVLLSGAIPVFAEIDDTLCLSPESVRSAISSRTAAVLPVHMCGAMGRIDAIEKICKTHQLVLIEDACQSVGGTFNGRAAGTIGSMGCFSFDPVKTITCGEGGAVVTNSEKLYKIADAFADHGHDHLGEDRGKENHPILGFNYRISELNAAVGLAQLRKLDRILEKQRSHKAVLKDALSGCNEISFRQIPDPSGDTATFLSFFLPDETTARKAVDLLTRENIDGCFYWYDNNWHYIRQWEHLKNFSTAAKLPIMDTDVCSRFRNISLPFSDKIISRNISMLIKLSWSREEVEERAEKMLQVINSI